LLPTLHPLERTHDGGAGWHRTVVGAQDIWAAHGLKPHLTKTFKLSRDPNFVAKVEDIVRFTTCLIFLAVSGLRPGGRVAFCGVLRSAGCAHASASLRIS
jgi:hypothetical protein